MNTLQLRQPSPARQRGVALPVMMIMLVVMLIGSIYLFKSSNSTTLTTANLAYDATLSKTVDFGLLTGFQWLSDTATANRQLLNADSAANGYVATLDTALQVTDTAFWTGSQTAVDADHNSIEYVIHRMCSLTGAYDAIGPPANACMQTAANTSTLNNSVAIGDSLSSDAQSLAGMPQVHYVVTARIVGARGGYVVNQAVVLIGV
jgi:Tfp pilus assembly protein PilX